MTVWAFNKPGNKPGDGAVEFVYHSVQQAFSRFGWSYKDDCDLTVLEKKDNKNEEDIKCWKQSHFLLSIEPGDWIVHINVPSQGRCTTVKVIGKYTFDPGRNHTGSEYTNTGDYRHRIPVDPETILEFNRNDPNVHPFISRRLKLRGAHWEIRDGAKFEETIENIRKT